MGGEQDAQDREPTMGLDEQILHAGTKPAGMKALEAAALTRKEVVEEPEIQPGVAREGDSWAAMVEPGTALESTDDFLSRLEADAGSEAGTVEEPAAQPGDAQPTGQAPPQSQPTSQATAIQAENDRLKQLVKDLQQDAQIGQFVRNDEYLLRQVGDSMRGVSPQAAAGVPRQSRYEQSIEEELGLGPTFVFDPTDANVPGTPTHRWLQAFLERNVGNVVDQRIADYEETARVKQAGQQEKLAFLGAGHSEADFNSLIEWIGSPQNFTLMKLWDYMHLEEKLQQVASAASQRPGRREHIPSISAASGGGIPEPTDPATNLKVGLLRMARRNKNPLAD